MSRPIPAPAVPPAPSIARRAGPVLGIVALLVGLGAVGFAAAFANREPPSKVTSDAADAQSRRIDVTLADIQATWGRLFSGMGRGYRIAGHRYFVEATPAPCAGAGQATGPFYCPDNRALYFDLALFAAMPAQMREIEDQATKLVIAAVAAGPALDQLGGSGSVAGTDCLAGVWARDAARRIGPVPEGRYGLAILGTRRVAEARASWWGGGPEALGGLGLGTIAEREAAFQRGYAAGDPKVCLAS